MAERRDPAGGRWSGKKRKPFDGGRARWSPWLRELNSTADPRVGPAEELRPVDRARPVVFLSKNGALVFAGTDPGERARNRLILRN